MLHPSWRTALRRLAAKLTPTSRTRRRAVLGRDPKLEERLAPAALLSSRMVTGSVSAVTVRTTNPTPATLTAPDMPGLSALSPAIAGAIVRAWQVPTEATTAEWVVSVAPGQDPQAVFGSGFEYSPVGVLADTYVAKSGTPQLVSQAANQFAGAKFYYPVMPVDAQVRFIPNDPRFPDQWHLRNTGQTGGLAGQDIKAVPTWDNFKGNGVVIGIVDDGLEHTHPDLNPNYVAAHSFDFSDNDSDPNAGDHGTAVAGVAAARGNNGIGVTGAAFMASLAGLRILGGNFSDQVAANALSYHPQDIDIYNNSWGPPDNGALGSIGPLSMAALQQGVTNGRGGLGNVYVWAAGNGGSVDNVNYDGIANSRYVIAVGAIGHKGEGATYSEPGAPMLVTTYSASFVGNAPGITTTDANGGYQDDFNGTSSSSPLAAGAIALILEANPNLSWRDVQHILVRTARKNSPTDAGWTKNKAGFDINHKFGFGSLDVNAAVKLAQTWTPVKPEINLPVLTASVGKPIPDSGAAVSSTVTVAQNIKVEHVEVVFDATHTNRGNLEVVLTAPSGTKSVLAETRSTDPGDNYSKWTFSSVRHWGELSGGKWTLTVRDKTTGDTGTFNNWQLAVYGTTGIPPTLSGVEATPVSVLENKTGKVSAGVTVSDPNSQTLSGATVAITGNFQPGQDVLGLSGAGVVSGSFNGGTGVLTLTGPGTLADYRTALRSVTYKNTSEDPIALPRTITFQVADDAGEASNKMSRILNVIPVNDAPSFTKGPDISVLEDSGPYQNGEGWATNISPGPEAGQTVSMEIVENSNPGLFAGSPFLSGTGTLVFTPAPDVSGSAKLRVRARDDGGTANGGINVSPTEELVITVVPVNDGPTAVADTFTTKEDGTLLVVAPGVLANDRDPEGNPISATKLSDPQNGSLVFNANGSFTYTPDPDFTGQDSFTYRASDPEFTSAPTTVTINVAPVNDGPTANDDMASSNGTPTQISVLTNDTDPDGDTLRVASYTAPTLGRITRSGSSLVYTPNPGSVGTDVFSYTVMDAGGATDTAQVTVTVTDAVAPEVRSARVKYGTASSAVLDLDSLGRSVLPWANVTAFSFQFNETVTANPSALTLSDASGNALTLNFTYDAASRTATWTVPTALGVGRYSLRLDASLVTDGSANPMASDWGKAFAVLPGDFDGNGVVDDTDLNSIRANFSLVGRPTNRWADVTGDGVVNDADLQAAQSNFGRRI